MFQVEGRCLLRLPCLHLCGNGVCYGGSETKDYPAVCREIFLNKQPVPVLLNSMVL